MQAHEDEKGPNLSLHLPSTTTNKSRRLVGGYTSFITWIVYTSQPGPRPWHKRAAKCMKKVQTTVCHRLRYVFLFNSLFICFTNDYLHLGMSITSETVAKGTTTNRSVKRLQPRPNDDERGRDRDANEQQNAGKRPKRTVYRHLSLSLWGMFFFIQLPFYLLY